MKTKYLNILAVSEAILAAVLFGMNDPFSKMLLVKLTPFQHSSMLYFGAGIGMLIVFSIRKLTKQSPHEASLSVKELPFIIPMVLLDIAAPILLMIGLTQANSSTASLLGNFEIVATAIIATALFREKIGPRLWVAITMIIISSTLLSVADFRSLSFTAGSLFIILACTCWGFENNCSRKLSIKDPLQIVIIKGIGSGIGSLIIALSLKQFSWDITYMMFSLLLGFFAYGLSIYLYVHAQRWLGAARTSAFYAFAPFIGVGLSFLLFKETLARYFYIALIIMFIGSYLAIEKAPNIVKNKKG